MEIRFLEDREVKNGRGEVVKRFETGQVVDLPEASANHWLSRGFAVDAAEPVEDDGEDDVEGDGEDDGEPDGESADPGAVVIPEDWNGLHHAKLINMAEAITGDAVKKKVDAVAIIEAEIERRAKSDDGDADAAKGDE